MFTKVFVVCAVFSATQAAVVASGLSCNECRQIAYTVGGLAISPGAMEASYQMVKEPVCAALPAEFDCEENLPWFWKVLGAWMFNPAEGWYSPKYFCEDLCKSEDSENEISSGITCKACSDRLFGNIAFMANEDILTKAVSDFKAAKFCDQFAEEDGDVEQCNKALDIVVPIGMTIMSESGDKWIPGVCKENVKCRN